MSVVTGRKHRRRAASEHIAEAASRMALSAAVCHLFVHEAFMQIISVIREPLKPCDSASKIAGIIEVDGESREMTS